MHCPCFLFLGELNSVAPIITDGRKSWAKYTFVALFHMRQANSHARIHLHLFSPFPNPSMLDTCTRYFTEFQHCIFFWGGGGKQTHFETDNSAFLKLRFKNTEN